ncbi:MAG: flagellar basal-body MS-ring/collar protein FliF [Burkholderiaceae bacterium]
MSSDATMAAPAATMIPAALKPRLAMAAGILALTAIIAWSFISLKEPPYKVLFANLSDRDGGAIIAALSQKNIPYKFAAGGDAILVPQDNVHGLRLELASQGLPRGDNTGFEILDEPRFGMTQFQERLSYQRGLQGELTRSIESLAAVESARVHLAIPENGGFLRGRQKPSASVLVRLLPGRVLTRNQTAGIINLVAASIPRLNPADVKVIDQDGALLSADQKSDDLPNAAQLAYSRQVEQSLSERITELLEAVVGRGNVRARVTADMDFSLTQSTDETFRPNQTQDSAAVRSQQLTGASARKLLEAGGIPGALTNQPGADPAAPINGPAQDPAAAERAAAGAANTNDSSEAIVNYEVDKSTRVTRNGSGNIRRLTAAVVVNYRSTPNAEGEVTQTALSAEELEKMNALVREAIGFSAERGDSINIMNSPFQQAAIVEEPDLPLWQDPQMISMAMDLARHLGIALLGLVVVFKVIRPAMKAMTAPPPEQAQLEQDPAPGGDSAGTSQLVDTVVEDEVELMSPEEQARLEAQKRRDETLRLARENPKAVAHIVRDWVTEDE